MCIPTDDSERMKQCVLLNSKQTKKESTMQGIKVESEQVRDDFQDAETFLVEINGIWYKVGCSCTPMYDPPEEQKSDNVYKWTSYGKKYQFHIIPHELPQPQELPAMMRQFLERYLATGCKEAEFRDLAKGAVCPAGEKAGWQT
jgi:hypothetical protein